MKTKKTLNKLSVVSPVRYRITILGFLDENMTDCLGDLTIESQETVQEGGKYVITLIGRLPDQAALLGALNGFYNMRMPLLAVEFLGTDDQKAV